MANIIVRHYEHWNSAMGIYIKSKKHYINEVSKRGFIPMEKAAEIAEKAKNKSMELGEPSKKAMEIIRSAKNSADRNGNIKPGNRLIDGMKEVGVKFTVPNWCPKHYKEGGFV